MSKRTTCSDWKFKTKVTIDVLCESVIFWLGVLLDIAGPSNSYTIVSVFPIPVSCHLYRLVSKIVAAAMHDGL